ncbi:hypothetical protein Anas_08984 [Armadillidium nasatum]|uniref:Uncharacterized protein n=1 Tax=Armadillidium nasatum TaxID=96803 RepID=A0A5N5SNS7_9CRUS|nr:hypothetical protein Anas_08984 [Armadillidium nasatum]
MLGNYYSWLAVGFNGGNRSFTIPKKLKRKPGRPPDSSYNSNCHPLSLDTELGYSEKQQLRPWSSFATFEGY